MGEARLYTSRESEAPVYVGVDVSWEARSREGAGLERGKLAGGFCVPLDCFIYEGGMHARGTNTRTNVAVSSI